MAMKTINDDQEEKEGMHLYQELRQNVKEENYQILNRILKICNQNYPYKFKTILKEKCLIRHLGCNQNTFCIQVDDGNVYKICEISKSDEYYGEADLKSALSELMITTSVSNLKNGTENSCTSFVNLFHSWFIWDFMLPLKKYGYTKSQKKKIFIVYEMEYAGKPLGRTKFNNIQVMAIISQLGLALTVAEEALQFEHRNLNMDNILWTETTIPCIKYEIKGAKHCVKTCGIKVTITDFEFSRATIHGEIFGVPQKLNWEQHRFKKQEIADDWNKFCPRTNLWHLIQILRFLIWLSDNVTHLRWLRDTRQYFRTLPSSLVFCQKYCDKFLGQGGQIADRCDKIVEDLSPEACHLPLEDKETIGTVIRVRCCQPMCFTCIGFFVIFFLLVIC